MFFGSIFKLSSHSKLLVLSLIVSLPLFASVASGAIELLPPIGDGFVHTFSSAGSDDVELRVRIGGFTTPASADTYFSKTDQKTVEERIDQCHGKIKLGLIPKVKFDFILKPPIVVQGVKVLKLKLLPDKAEGIIKLPVPYAYLIDVEGRWFSRYSRRNTIEKKTLVMFPVPIPIFNLADLAMATMGPKYVHQAVDNIQYNFPALNIGKDPARTKGLVAAFNDMPERRSCGSGTELYQSLHNSIGLRSNLEFNASVKRDNAKSAVIWLITDVTDLEKISNPTGLLNADAVAAAMHAYTKRFLAGASCHIHLKYSTLIFAGQYLQIAFTAKEVESFPSRSPSGQL